MLLALFYALAGVVHLIHPHPFERVAPTWVPYAHQVILVTGVCELAGAAALLVPRLRPLAGLMLALYAVCVYPANINHAVQDLSGLNPHGLGWLYHAPRLFAQPFIVWWALYVGGWVSGLRRVR